MATLPELLQTLVEVKGSDLHLTTQTPPQIRVHGKLQTLDLPPLGPAETKGLAYSVLTDGFTRSSSICETRLGDTPTRRVINLASGVRWERLTPHRDGEVEFLYVVYPVGAASCPEDALMTHGGKEYGYVVSGTLGVRVGFEEYELGPGGSIAFDSSSPHRLWTIGDQPVHAVWVVIGREADPRTPHAVMPRVVAD